MRSSRAALRVLVALLAGAALAAGALVSPAAAGGDNLAFGVNVVGPVPAGTTFTVAWSCPSNNAGNQSGTFDFDSTGAPISGSGVTVNNTGSCSATETQQGNAATVTSACSVSGSGASCTDNHTVQWTNLGLNPNGNVTFTDGYLPGLTVAPPSGAPGQQFTVSSTGCTKALFGGSASTGGPVQVTAGFSPPIVMNTTAAGTTGAWSVPFTVPANAGGGAVPISATCNDPAQYAGAAFTVISAATPIVASPAFTG
jgi:hypothetical protein